MPVLTKDGRFAISPHHKNLVGRGDKGYRESKKQSMKTVGLRLDWDSPPWVMQHEDPAVDDRFYSMHWGRRFEGLLDAWLEDTGKNNPWIQEAVQKIIPGVKKYRRTLVDDAAKFLIEWGNLGNDNSTVCTPLQIAALCPDIVRAFKYNKDLQHVEKDGSKSHVVYTKLTVANGMVNTSTDSGNNFSWSSYTSWERTNTMSKDKGDLRLLSF